MTGAEITVFIKSGGPLSKHIHLVDGRIGNDDGSCRMTKGSARRVRIDLANPQALADLHNGFTSHEAYALGRLKDGLPDRVRIGTKRAVAKGDPGVARSKENLVYRPGEPGVALIDLRHEAVTTAANPALPG